MLNNELTSVNLNPALNRHIKIQRNSAAESRFWNTKYQSACQFIMAVSGWKNGRFWQKQFIYNYEN